MRPVPVPISSRLRNGFAPIMASERRFDPLLGRMQRANLIPIGGARGEIGRGLLAARLARNVEADAVGVDDRIGRIETAQPFARQRRRPVRPGERRPRRPRAVASASPASTSSRRWRETRGCDWPRMATSSLTVSSATSNRQRMRSRVSSPAASRPVSKARKASGGALRSLDISISLYVFCCRSSGMRATSQGKASPVRSGWSGLARKRPMEMAATGSATQANEQRQGSTLTETRFRHSASTVFRFRIGRRALLRLGIAVCDGNVGASWRRTAAVLTMRRECSSQ